MRYSHRDTSFSSHFDNEYPIDELVQDMAGIIKELKQPIVHLVGRSMGGYLAQIAMCKFPGMFASVTSISAGPTVSPEVAKDLGLSGASEATWQTLMRNQPQGDLEKDLPGWLISWRLLNGSRAFDELAAIRYTRYLYDGDVRNRQVAYHHMHAMSTVPTSLAKELTKVRCPFLVMHGTEDPLVPVDNGEASARLVPGSKMYHLVGAGHMFFNKESWQEIAENVLRHIRAV